MTKFTPDEIAKVPPSLRPLMQEFPISFDALIEMQGQGPIKGPIKSQDIYFDDESAPAFGATSDGEIYAGEATETPTVISAFINGECAYVQVGDHILGNRVQHDYLQVFPL